MFFDKKTLLKIEKTGLKTAKTMAKYKKTLLKTSKTGLKNTLFLAKSIYCKLYIAFF
jgi:hypothetical protein